MGNAKIFKLVLVLVFTFGIPLSSFAGCAAETKKSADGSYGGCVVKMGNREFTIAANQSSEDGCSQVCSIMSEISGSNRSGKSQASLTR
jgi:hypothetical protein